MLEVNARAIKPGEMLGMLLVTTGGGLGLVCFGPISERLGRRGAFLFFLAGGFVSTLVLFRLVERSGDGCATHVRTDVSCRRKVSVGGRLFASQERHAVSPPLRRGPAKVLKRKPMVHCRRVRPDLSREFGTARFKHPVLLACSAWNPATNRASTDITSRQKPAINTLR